MKKYIKRIPHIWKGFLYFLLTGSATLLIAACYGMYMNYEQLRIRAVDKDTQSGIANLRISLIDISTMSSNQISSNSNEVITNRVYYSNFTTNTLTTGSDGATEPTDFYHQYNFILAEDIDGSNNDSYLPLLSSNFSLSNIYNEETESSMISTFEVTLELEKDTNG